MLTKLSLMVALSVTNALASAEEASTRTDGPRPNPADADLPGQVEGDRVERGPVELSESQAAMVRALSARDGSPSCAELAELSTDPLSDHLYIVNNVSSPPWVGMRAAECVITQHPEAGAETMRAWVTTPELKGLGWLVLRNLDDMPRELALGLAQTAIADGPDPAGARKRVKRAKTEEIRAVAE